MSKSILKQRETTRDRRNMFECGPPPLGMKADGQRPQEDAEGDQGRRDGVQE